MTDPGFAAEFNAWFAGLEGDDDGAQETALTLIGIERASRDCH